MDLVGKSKLKDLRPLRFIGCTAYIEHCGYLLLETIKISQLKDYEAERLVKRISSLENVVRLHVSTNFAVLEDHYV